MIAINTFIKDNIFIYLQVIIVLFYFFTNEIIIFFPAGVGILKRLGNFNSTNTEHL